MHPDDNMRVPSIDAVDNWPTDAPAVAVKNGSVIVNGGNGSAGQWPPLLTKDVDNEGGADSYIRTNGKTRNNNEWRQNGGSGGGGGKSDDDVYGKYNYWPEDGDGALRKLGGNNNGSLINNKGLLGANGLSAELDPLTGDTKEGSRVDRESDEISQCGIGSCQPKWARSFATTHAFMVVFLLAWILQVRKQF